MLHPRNSDLSLWIYGRFVFVANNILYQNIIVSRYSYSLDMSFCRSSFVSRHVRSRVLLRDLINVYLQY